MLKIGYKRKTILLAVEGTDDQRFVQYIRELYKTNSASIKIISMHGGSPVVGVSKVLAYQNGKEFDIVYYFTDTDRDWTKVLFNKASKVNINLIGIEPLCLEGLLLKLLDEKIPTTAKKCKSQLKNLLKSKRYGLKDLSSLETCIPKKIIDRARKNIRCLDELILIFENNF